MKENANSPSFYWQTGYGAFSVSRSKVKITERYIAHQQIHHKQWSYLEEIEQYMKRYDVVENNPTFFWKE